MFTEVAAMSLNLPFHDFALLGFYGITAIYIIFTGIMYYHWKEYSIDTVVTNRTLLLYFITTLPLILAIYLSTTYI